MAKGGGLGSSCDPLISSQLDIMEPKVPDDTYKTHLENNSEWTSPCVWGLEDC